MLHKPAEGALDDPTLGQHFETALVLETGDNFQAQAASLAMRGDPGSESSTQIALIGPDATQPTEPLEGLGEESASAGLFRNIGRGHTNPEQQAQGVHQNVALAPFDLLARIVTPRSAVIGGTYRLAIEDGGGGLRTLAHLAADNPAQHLVNEFPQPLSAPSAEAAIDGLPRAKFSGQEPPSAARPDEIEQTVEDEAPVGRRTTPSFGSGKHRFEEFPLSVAQIGRIQTTFSHPDRVTTPLGQRLSNPQKHVITTMVKTYC